jgi:hypothetical protein
MEENLAACYLTYVLATCNRKRKELRLSVMESFRNQSAHRKLLCFYRFNLPAVGAVCATRQKNRSVELNATEAVVGADSVELMLVWIPSEWMVT